MQYSGKRQGKQKSVRKAGCSIYQGKISGGKRLLVRDRTGDSKNLGFKKSAGIIQPLSLVGRDIGVYAYISHACRDVTDV